VDSSRDDVLTPQRREARVGEGVRATIRTKVSVAFAPLGRELDMSEG
jgi:hypothetical protein